MNITIDCRMLESSGVGTYLNGCLPQFINSPNNFLLLGNPEKLFPFTENKKNCNIEECSIKPFSFNEIAAFPNKLLNKINNNDLYYSPYFNIPPGIKKPVFTTIHDIVFPDMPELVSKPGLYARLYFYKRAAKKSNAVITVSGFSKDRIEYHLGKKIPVINALNAAKIPDINQNYSGFDKKKYILFIGNIKKHKGLNILLDAFINCLDKGLDYKLIIMGNKDGFRSGDNEFTDRLEKINNANLVFTGYIPDNEKNKLLTEAALLVQHSLYEGFGYPPLEAMLSGTKALISDIPVFREIYNEFPVTFFKSGDNSDLGNKIMDLLYKKEPESLYLPDHLKNKYTFKKTVSMILLEMEKSISNKGKPDVSPLH